MSSKIKKNLIKNNIKKEICEKCNLTTWLNQKIPLELHHVDGDRSNIQLNNLQLLCLNCHSLTPNYRGKNKKIGKKPINDKEFIYLIPLCQSITEVLKTLSLETKGANYERVHSIIKKYNLKLKPRQLSEKELEARLKSRKIVRPSKEELQKMLWEKPSTLIAIELGISDSALVKWCHFYQITKPPRGYWAKKQSTQKGTCTPTSITDKSS